MSIADYIKAFVEEHEEYTLYEGYSGQFMFGKSCLGVVISEGNSYMSFLMELTEYLCQQNVEDKDLALDGVSCDSLGLDTIVYFPRIEG